MSDMFDEEDDLVEGDPFVGSDETVDMDVSEGATLDARRRLENMLEERRLQSELDDFMDY
ncbi:MAG: hypothetical protein WC785_03140 [Tatlockia sp.]|jgi:hypothetical protein